MFSSRYFLSAVTLLLIVTPTPSTGQSLLQDPGLFTPVLGLNTVPDHGDAAVSFLDYRNNDYWIVVVDLSTGIRHELGRVFYAEPEVSTFEQRVAWIEYTADGQPDVYLHDRATGQTTRITTDVAFQNHPDLAAGILVWQDYRNAGGAGKNADIYRYDFETGTTGPVTTDPGYQDTPRVHGNWVVWQDFRHAGPNLDTAEIYALDLATGQERRLTTGAAYRANPSVWGNLVVWEDYRNGSNGDIYLYDLSANREMPVTADTAHQNQPAVSGDWVLWLDYRNSPEQGDLYGYHLKTRQEYALLVDPAHQDAPHLYGNHVVWQDYRDGRFDLYAGSLADPTLTAIENVDGGGRFELTAAPNPFDTSVSLLIKNAPDSPLRLIIYDMLGRVIARRPFLSTESAITWDGRTEAGLTAPPGVYVGVVYGLHQHQRILLVRQGS